MNRAGHEGGSARPARRGDGSGSVGTGRGASAVWRLETPANAGAVAVIAIFDAAGRMGSTLEALGLGSVAPGACVLRELWGIDRGLVARLGDRNAWLMPHGGGAVVRAVCSALESRGLARADAIGIRDAYPEASDEIEARVLDAICRATSPMAIDLLLDQPRRWRVGGAASDPSRDSILHRLVSPPLVVAVGASNIGKSTLLNTLAGRGVSIVADEPGTTRDHVGVMLDIGGLWIRFMDTPGVRDVPGDLIEQEAITRSQSLVARADLVLACGDPGHPPLENWAALGLRVCLRSDLGAAAWASDVRVSCQGGDGVEALVLAMRERLVPAAVRSHPGPWRFWAC